MPITDQLLTGLNLMFMGMGIVFTFLVILVFSMLLMSKLVMASDKRGTGQTQAIVSFSSDQQSDEVRGDVVAVIAAAIIRYRTTHN